MRNTVIQCEKWLSDEVSKAGANGIILGLSGGIDSSVLAALGREALGREGVLGVIMPCNSNPDDEDDAKSSRILLMFVIPALICPKRSA